MWSGGEEATEGLAGSGKGRICHEWLSVYLKTGTLLLRAKWTHHSPVELFVLVSLCLKGSIALAHSTATVNMNNQKWFKTMA